MLNLLQNLKENLSSNWTYVHKIIFTFAFYLLFKVFLKVLDFEEIIPFALIFIILGFLVFTIDKLIDPLIDILLLFSKDKNKIDKNRRKTALLVLFLLIIAIISTISYYIFDYYPLVNVVIYTMILAVLCSAFFLDFSSKKIKKTTKISISVLAIIGFIAVAQSFYTNYDLNVNFFLFIFIFGFFILDYRIGVWKKYYLK